MVYLVQYFIYQNLLNAAGHFSFVHKRFAPKDQIMETNKTVDEWKTQLHETLMVLMK